jgi:acid phosphatase
MALSRLFPLTLLLAGLAACDTMPTRVHAMPEPDSALAPVFAPAAAAVAGDDNLNAVAWMQTSVEFRLISGQTFRSALGQLDRAIKTPSWDALPQADRDTPIADLPPAIIVDVDETVLDNAPSQVRQIRERRGFDEAQWGAWVSEQKAKPLAGAVEFLSGAAKQGVTVYYVTNRDASLTDATIANLRSAGFPVASDAQVLGLGTVVDDCEQEGSEKSCRRQLVGRTHRVLMQFGDQVGDFVQIVANTPEGRREAVTPYMDWIGERWFVLPNPMYGSWEPALFGNDWRQPAAQRRAAKEAALDDAK